MKVALIDYDSGNLHSAEKAFQLMGREVGADEGKGCLELGARAEGIARGQGHPRVDARRAQRPLARVLERMRPPRGGRLPRRPARHGRTGRTARACRDPTAPHRPR